MPPRLRNDERAAAERVQIGLSLRAISIELYRLDTSRASRVAADRSENALGALARRGRFPPSRLLRTANGADETARIATGACRPHNGSISRTASRSRRSAMTIGAATASWRHEKNYGPDALFAIAGEPVRRTGSDARRPAHSIDANVRPCGHHETQMRRIGALGQAASTTRRGRNCASASRRPDVDRRMRLHDERGHRGEPRRWRLRAVRSTASAHLRACAWPGVRHVPARPAPDALRCRPALSRILLSRGSAARVRRSIPGAAPPNEPRGVFGRISTKRTRTRRSAAAARPPRSQRWPLVTGETWRADWDGDAKHRLPASGSPRNYARRSSELAALR